MAEEQIKTSAKKKIDLTIITPRGVKFVEQADMIIMRAIDGDIGIYPGHEPLSTVLGDGVLRIINDDYEKKLAVFGGTVDIEDQSVQILTTIAQRPEEIDLDRAEEDRLEAEAKMQDELEEKMTRRLHVMQMRALVRIHVSQPDYFDDIEDEKDTNNTD